MTLKHLKIRMKLLLIIVTALVGIVLLASMSLWFLKPKCARQDSLIMG